MLLDGKLSKVGVAPDLAFLMCHVPVSCRRSGEFGSATRAVRFRGAARLLPLMAEEVAESGELPAVTSMVPASRLWASANNSNIFIRPWRLRRRGQDTRLSVVASFKARRRGHGRGPGSVGTVNKRVCGHKGLNSRLIVC